MRKSAPNPLHYFPFFAKDWLSSPARMAMSPAQRGAYIDLLALAWGNGDDEPCLDPAPEILSGLSGLGADWERLSPLILAQFTLRNGLLYNAKLSQVWRDSHVRHERAVARGKKGGRPTKHKEKTVLSPQEDATKQSYSEDTVKTPTEFLPVSPPEALGVETPRPAERPMERGTRNPGWSIVRDVIGQIPGIPKPRPA